MIELTDGGGGATNEISNKKTNDLYFGWQSHMWTVSRCKNNKCLKVSVRPTLKLPPTDDGQHQNIKLEGVINIGHHTYDVYMTFLALGGWMGQKQIHDHIKKGEN